MAKDPATLWYWNDWLAGTMTLSRHLKGCYMDLLGAQFNNDKLTLDEIKTVLGSDFGTAWPTLQKKFLFDNGFYFNVKGYETKNKRAEYTKSRRKNLTPHMGSHMENENEIIIDNELENKYTKEMISDFLRYWNEPNKKGKRRWELQETWSTDRRLITWFNNQTKFNKNEQFTSNTTDRLNRQKSVENMESLAIRVLKSDNSTDL